MRGVIFDLWNTLIRSDGPRLVTRISTLVYGPEASAPLEVDVTDYLRSTGCLNRRVSTAQLAHDLWERRYNEPAPDGFDQDVADALEEFVQHAVFVEGAQDLLEELNRMGLRLGVVSNATSASLDVIDRIGIKEFTRDIWVSCLSGYLKPDPRALTTVAKEWNLDPASICMVGDRLTTDVLGARLCGMEAIWFAPHLSRSFTENPSSILAVVNSLADVPASLFAGGILTETLGEE